MISYTIYLVDDEPSIRQGVAFGFKDQYHVESFSSAEDAIDAIRGLRPDLVLLDIGLPGMSGIEALREIKGIEPDMLVIMITAYEDINTVISTMKLGAYDYVIKPIHMDSLRVCVKNALETIKLRKEIQVLQENYIRENLPCFVGESNAIQDVIQFTNKVAKSPDTPILILGESGTGKELIASAIHYKSPNFKGPFVTLNCAALPEELIESELFGYEKGAFSGASAAGKIGLIEEASNGTLFLDEVGDLSLSAQARLLRFIELGEYYRVGGTKKLRIRTRIVSATNKDLEDMIEKGLFRLDLYYRLGVIKLEIPSLNNRRDDIIPIAKYFLMEFSKKQGKSFSGFSGQAEEFLMNHHWRGNIRELRNLIERAVLVGDGPDLTLQDLGLEKIYKGGNGFFSKRNNNDGFPPLSEKGIDLNALEEHYITEALKKAEGNDAKAAKYLNMSYYSFRYRRKKINSHQRLKSS
jgi:two-component system response regulator AtoC